MDASEILDMYLQELGDNNLSKETLIKIRGLLLQWMKRLSFQSMDITDIRTVRDNMQKDFSKNYYRGCVSEFKRFCRWLIEKKYSNISFEQIQKIKVPSPDKMTKRASDMLSEEDIEKIILMAHNSRDRAVLAMMYAGRMRPVELMRLTWGDLQYDDYGVVINTSEKTGIARRVRLLGVKQYLAQWRADSEGFGFKTGKDNPVFVKFNSGDPVSYSVLYQIFERSIRPKFDKKVYPYLLRHSKITQMVADGIPESAIKLETWGTLNTNMLATYAHLTGAQTDELILQASGEKPKETRKRRGKLVCEKCLTENLRAADYCIKCGLALSEEAKEREKKKEDQLVGRVYEKVKADWESRLGLG